MKPTYTQAPIEYLLVNGLRVAYKRIGIPDTPIVIYLNHLAANLDGCDPIIMDSLAQHFTVISFDYRGIGYSEGSSRTSVEEMAQDTINFIQALGYNKVHLLGLSLGGFVTQALMRLAPQLVDKVILAGTGPASDKGIAKVPRITFWDMTRGAFTRKDARYYLFFPNNMQATMAANQFIARSAQCIDKDRPTSLPTLLR